MPKDEFMKLFRIIFSVALMFMLFASPGFAQDSGVTYGSATVDGDPSEWDLDADFFANMYTEGNSDKPILSTLYLRYDCSTNVLYALVLDNPDDDKTPKDSAGDAWIKIYGQGWSNNKLIDGAGEGNTEPRGFEWVRDDRGQVIGYEAYGWLAEGSYIKQFEAHLNVAGETSSTGKNKPNKNIYPISLIIDCNEPPAPEPSAKITKYQWDDEFGDWVVDPLYGIDVGDTLSYEIVVEDFSNFEDVGLTIQDTLIQYLDYEDTDNTMRVLGSDGNDIDSAYYDFTENPDDLLTWTFTPEDLEKTLLSTDSLTFLFDATVNDKFGLNDVIKNSADLKFKGKDPLKSNIVEAYAVPEPGTLFLLGIGLLGMFGLGRKLRKR